MLEPTVGRGIHVKTDIWSIMWLTEKPIRSQIQRWITDAKNWNVSPFCKELIVRDFLFIYLVSSSGGPILRICNGVHFFYLYKYHFLRPLGKLNVEKNVLSWILSLFHVGVMTGFVKWVTHMWCQSNWEKAWHWHGYAIHLLPTLHNLYSLAAKFQGKWPKNA